MAVDERMHTNVCKNLRLFCVGLIAFTLVDIIVVSMNIASTQFVSCLTSQFRHACTDGNIITDCMYLNIYCKTFIR